MDQLLDLVEGVQLEPIALLDIFLTAVLLYGLFNLIQGTRAVRSVVGAILLYLLYVVAQALDLRLLSGIMQIGAVVGLFALVVVFQPELRRGLDRLGRVGSLRWLGTAAPASHERVGTIIAGSAAPHSARRTGAIIVIAPDTVLAPRPGSWESRTAMVRVDGLLDVDGKTFDSPSGAGRHVKGSITNGWSFWRLPDGRKLADVRAIYTAEDPAKGAPGFDWTALHTILEALPVGHWTTYGSLADAVGTAPVPLGNHVAGCKQCTNAHRILRNDGTVAPNFASSDSGDQRDPAEMLQAEGAFVNARADPARELTSDGLQVLIEQ